MAAERPWWLRRGGRSPGYERKVRARWPDWDQLDVDQRVHRERDWERGRIRSWLARHPVLVLVVGTTMLLWSLADTVMTLLDPNAHPAEVPWRVVITLVVIVSSAWWFREFRRGRRGR